MMLIGVNSIMSPDPLTILREMGHGNEIEIVDGNYPALAHARRLIRLDGLTLIPVIDTVLSVLPVDDFIDGAFFRSAVSDRADDFDEIHHQIVKICKQYLPKKLVFPLVGGGLLCAC